MTKETYDLNLHCLNCKHNFVQTIPFGADFEEYRWGEGSAHFTYTIIACPECGSGKVIREKKGK